MKLRDMRKTITEIWRFPTRVVKRVNAGTVRASQSDFYSPSNKLDPSDYFIHSKSPNDR